MDCRDIECLIQLDIDHCLPDGMRAEYAAHLAACPACARLREELLALDTLLAAEMGRVEPPAGFVASVMAALPARKPAPQPKRLAPQRLRRAFSLVAAAAALLLFAGLTGWFGQSTDELPEMSLPPVVANNDELRPEAPEQPIIAENDDPTPPDNPDTGDNDSDQQPDTTPPDNGNPTEEQPVEEDPPAYTHSVGLPPVASSNVATGEYSLITLASYLDYDALAPRVSGNTVSYYLLVDDVCQEWQVALDLSSLPAFMGECEHVPEASGEGKYHRGDYGDYYSAVSPDGAYTAFNRGDDPQGLFLQAGDQEAVQVSENGGGSILSWSADSNRILFSDSNGALYAYYIAEGLTFTLYPGEVSSVSWGGDGKCVVFAGIDAKTGYSSIFRIIIP